MSNDDRIFFEMTVQAKFDPYSNKDLFPITSPDKGNNVLLTPDKISEKSQNRLKETEENILNFYRIEIRLFKYST